MSRPAARVLGMLELLQAHPGLTGAELGARLGVDGRTVRRYAGALADLGIPVVAARGRYGGYRLRPGYKLPPLMLTDDEALAVVLGLLAAERLGLAVEAGPAGFDPAAPAQPAATALALAKISRVLPPALADRLAAVRDSLGFTLRPGDQSARPASATLLALGAATRARRRVGITYRSWRGAPSARELDPYGLVFHTGRWYVTGHDHRRGEIRTFRLDRIVAVDTRAETFPVPDGFDPVGQVTRSLAAVPYRWSVRVLLETDLQQARRRIPASVAELTETPDGVLMQARAQQLDGMAQMLAGLGWSFTIVGPDELRAAVVDHAARLAALAGRQPAAGAGD